MSVLKNAAECTSQRLKWTSGARVMILVFDDYASKRQGVQAFKRSSEQAFKRSSDQAIKRSSEQAFKRSSENWTISGIKQKLDHPVDNPVVEMRYRMILPNHRMPPGNLVFVSHDAQSVAILTVHVPTAATVHGRMIHKSRAKF